MDFADAASYFNNDPVYDGYTGLLLFYCHTSPHDDHTSSGATSRRRTMTTVDNTTAPARRVVTIYGDPWLVSNSHPDAFRGENVRRSYSLKRSTGLMAKLTPAQAALGGAGTAFHAHKEYYRDNENARTEAEWDTMWNIFHAPYEALVKGSFLRQGGILYRVRSVYETVEDISIAETDQLDFDAVQDATFTALGDVDLVTDTQTAISTLTTVVQTDTQKFYKFRTLAESLEQKPGDRMVFVAKSVLTPKVNSTFSMMGSSWRVLSVVSEADAWALHARMA